MYSSDMEDNDFILTLIISSLSEDITEEEAALLKKILKDDKGARDLYQEIHDLLMSDEAITGRTELSKYAPVFITAKHPVRKILDLYYKEVSIAAMIIIILTFFIMKPQKESNTISKLVLPCRDSIQLVLNNKKVIDQGRHRTTLIGSSKGEQDTYVLATNEGDTGALHVPAGKVHNLVLSDGTVVKINATTTVTFPLKFGNTREIYLSGKADFDIAQD